MAIKNKLYFSERIANELYPVRTRDEKIDQREIILVMDSTCNALAKEGLLETWKLGETNSVDDAFCTTFEWYTPTDVANQSSYFTMPAVPIIAPHNGGIVQVYFRNNLGNKKKYYDPVIIMQHRDVAAYRNTLGGDLEGRLGVYTKNGILYFSASGIAAKYGEVGLQLMVRDSASISDDAVYPIPADYEAEFIMRCVAWFRSRKSQPVDVLKDNNDKP